MKFSPYSLVLVPLFTINLLAQEPFRVAVSVGEGSLESKINSYVRRELRDLGDLVIVDDVDGDPEYRISVVALETELQGYVMSWIITEILQPSEFTTWTLLEGEEPDEYTLSRESAEQLYGQLIGYEFRLRHLLVKGPSDHLRGRCEELVAEFDSEILEPIRALRQRRIDRRRNILENP